MGFYRIKREINQDVWGERIWRNFDHRNMGILGNLFFSPKKESRWDFFMKRNTNPGNLTARP